MMTTRIMITIKITNQNFNRLHQVPFGLDCAFMRLNLKVQVWNEALGGVGLIFVGNRFRLGGETVLGETMRRYAVLNKTSLPCSQSGQGGWWRVIFCP
jgi:hypothetical protein